MSEPKTLQQAVVYFSNPDRCVEYLATKRWPKGVICPTCGSDKVTFNPSRQIWQCSSHHAKRQFSVKVATIFEDSAIGLDKWLVAVWMVTNCKNGISSYEVARDLGVTQKTAWFMMHRIRLALQDETGGKLGGEVEADETYVGGLARNMHRDKKERKGVRTGGIGKVAVMRLLQRYGKKVKTSVLPDAQWQTLTGKINEHVYHGSHLFSGAWVGYSRVSGDYVHSVIDHTEAYAKENVHTNGLENYWSLLKRGIRGTYVSVEPFHLFRYLDEQAFRFNNRQYFDDRDRFDLAMSRVMGKCLTWNRLTGKSLDPETCTN